MTSMSVLRPLSAGVALVGWLIEQSRPPESTLQAAANMSIVHGSKRGMSVDAPLACDAPTVLQKFN